MSEPIEDCVEYLVATLGDCVRDHTPVGYSSVRDGMGDVLSACGLSQASLWEMVQRFAFFSSSDTTSSRTVFLNIPKAAALYYSSSCFVTP